jgi:hypothetical protein
MFGEHSLRMRVLKNMETLSLRGISPYVAIVALPTSDSSDMRALIAALGRRVPTPELGKNGAMKVRKHLSWLGQMTRDLP